MAKDAAQSGLGFSRQGQEQSGQLYGQLAPQLNRDIVAPTGFSPQEKATMNTAAQESTGGSMAGAVGQGALAAQRTRNAGTADAAIAESARGAGRNLSRAALGTELADAELKQRKEAAAKGEMGSLYGISSGSANQALGESAANTNADVNAQNASWNWAKYILDPALQAAGQGAKAFA